MKKTLLTFTVALTTSTITLNAQNVNIPSPNFKAYLVGESAINTNMDTEIQISEAQAFTGTINCANMYIGDLTGIEAFTSLTGLICWSAFISEMDLSNNVALTTLNCQNNFLTNLDLSQNVALTSIACGYNNLTSLNIANGNNANLTSLAVANTPNLTCIQIDDSDTTGYGWSGVGFEFDAGVSFSNSCGSTAGLSKPEAGETINIYPNPSTGQINFTKSVNAQIRTLTGQIISDSKNVNSIDISIQPAGIYILTLTDSEGYLVQQSKIVKQ